MLGDITRSKTERERAKKIREAAAEAAAAVAAAPAAKVKLADISKWKAFGLDKRLERGLGELGFSAPTKIQEECLPAAVLHGHVSVLSERAPPRPLQQLA